MREHVAVAARELRRPSIVRDTAKPTPCKSLGTRGLGGSLHRRGAGGRGVLRRWLLRSWQAPTGRLVLRCTAALCGTVPLGTSTCARVQEATMTTALRQRRTRARRRRRLPRPAARRPRRSRSPSAATATPPSPTSSATPRPPSAPSTTQFASKEECFIELLRTNNEDLIAGDPRRRRSRGGTGTTRSAAPSSAYVDHIAVAAGDHAELDPRGARARRGGAAAAPAGDGAPHRHAGRPQRQPRIPARAGCHPSRGRWR